MFIFYIKTENLKFTQELEALEFFINSTQSCALNVVTCIKF